MKTLELKLKKDVLIVDLEDNESTHIKGYEFLCDGSELTEEIASELVELTIMNLTYGDNKHKYRSYVNYNLGFNNAKESFISAVESNEKFWLENPIEKPINRDEYYKSEKVDSFEILLQQWQEAEEKTFRNPLIFVKK